MNSKEKKKKIYTGFISEDEYGFLCISEEKNPYNKYSIASEVSEDWKEGDKVRVRYYTTEEKTTSSEVRARSIKKMLGEMNVKYELDAYSEWTVLSWEENLTIGGHDLIKELAEYEGKYLVLIIEEIKAGLTPPQKGEK